MLKPRIRVLMAAVLAAIPLALPLHALAAADFKSVGADPAILYDAPTLRGKKVAIAPPGMPVDPVVAESDWVRVRDATGEFFWMEKKALIDKRMLVVNTSTHAVASIRAAATDTAPLVFQAKVGVLLEMLAPVSAGWVQVKHRDGQTGYVKATEVWGE